MSFLRRPGHGGRAFVQGELAFAMLHEPAGEHGGGVFFHPLVEEGRDFLAQIGRMAQPGKFVAMQAVAGSREEKLPRRLGGPVDGQGGLLGKGMGGVW